MKASGLVAIVVEDMLHVLLFFLACVPNLMGIVTTALLQPFHYISGYMLFRGP